MTMHALAHNMKPVVDHMDLDPDEGPRDSSVLSRSSSSSLWNQSQESSETDIYDLEPFAELGVGPLRFGPICRSLPVEEELKRRSKSQIERFIALKLECKETGLDKKFSNKQLFRVARYKKFSVTNSIRLLKKMDPRFISTTARQLEDQLRTKTIFPLPELRSKSIDSFFYMRASRYNPHESPVSTVIANLIYVMEAVKEAHQNTKGHKIGFVANMNGWTMRNFSTDYCWQFMQALQGQSTAVHVDLFLIVNPPKWFDKVWNIMKPMLSPNFCKKIHMIHEAALGEYLDPGFPKFLPDEFDCGKAPVSELVDDFIKFRKYVEESCIYRDAAALDHTKPTWSPNTSEKVDRWGVTRIPNRRASLSNARAPSPLLVRTKSGTNLLHKKNSNSNRSFRHLSIANGDTSPVMPQRRTPSSRCPETEDDDPEIIKPSKAGATGDIGKRNGVMNSGSSPKDVPPRRPRVFRRLSLAGTNV
eukprot:scaffold5092_cov179-Amphora_coffeaeformis.AAC.20